VEKQSRLLLRLYQAELTKDPASLGTESSRSNVIALHRTIEQIYGDVPGLVEVGLPAFPACAREATTETALPPTV
jgi:hypothetical protein